MDGMSFRGQFHSLGLADHDLFHSIHLLSVWIGAEWSLFRVK